MAQKSNHAWEQIKQYLWVLIVFEYVVFCLGLLFGRNVGYKNSIFVSCLLGLFVAVCFFSVIFLNGFGIFLYKLMKKLSSIFK